jgi:holo-[acyl-carrier protein] synthase
MDIVGIGIDAVDIPRVAQVLARFGERFLHRVFTSGEVAYCTCRRDPASPLAARFAAKEAAMKALGTGNAGGVLWQDIEVLRSGGPPRLVLHGGAAARANAMGVTRAFLTLTHSESVAFAEVMLVKD